MTTIDTLPVILVSAVSEAAATTLISELIDNDVTEDYLNDKKSPDRVWRLINKYYSVNVRVHPLSDHGPLKVDPEAIEAHIIYITKEEVSEGQCRAAAERRAAAGPWRRCALRLLLLDAAAAPERLRAWRGAARAHVVPLREAEPGAEAEREAEAEDEAGAARARAALHAHAWRGLQRTDRAPGADRRARRPADESSSSSSSCAGTDDEEGDELRAVEHAEAFAAALGALGPTLSVREPKQATRESAPASREPAPDPRDPAPDPRDPAPDPRDPAPDPRDPVLGADPRLDRAEALVTAFCRALGYDLDAC